MRARGWILVGASVAACGGGGGEEERSGGSSAGSSADKPKQERAYTGPMPIAFGDCAGPTVAFVSGPRPLPFALDDAELGGDPDATAAAAARAAVTGSVAPFDRSTDGEPLGDPDGSRTAGVLGRPDAGFGYGRLGFGPGGGTGLIGDTGPLGRSGTWSAGGRSRPAPGVTVTYGTAVVVGDLDKAIIRRYLKRNGPKLTYCMEKEMLARPSLGAGMTTARFTIDPKGHVTAAVAAGFDAKLDTCVASVITSIMFPAPKGGTEANVTFPLTFRAPGAAMAPIAVTPAPPDPVKPPPPTRVARERRLFRDDGGRGHTAYTPGAANPLAARSDALAACFRKDPRRRGAVVVGLTYDAQHTVASATVEGADKAIAACVADAAKGLKLPSAHAAERCPIAYGDTPIAEARGLDLGKSLTHDGIALAEVATLDGAPVKALVTALETRRMPILAPGGPAIAVHPPLVLRPDDATPMKAVYSAFASITAAREDAVLARQRDGEWTLLRPMSFPIAPVPFNTGGTWSPLKPLLRPRPDGAVPARLSVFVDRDRTVAIGATGAAAAQTFAAEPAQLENVLAALKQHKSSTAFADRTDLEVAAAGDITYKDVLAILDIAAKAGFIGWQLTDEKHLAQR